MYFRMNGDIPEQVNYTKLLGGSFCRHDFTVHAKEQSNEIARAFGKSVLAVQKNSLPCAFGLGLIGWHSAGKSTFSDAFLSVGGTLTNVENKYTADQFTAISPAFGAVMRIDRRIMSCDRPDSGGALIKSLLNATHLRLNIVEHADKASWRDIFHAVVHIERPPHTVKGPRHYSLYTVPAIANHRSFKTFLLRTSKYRASKHVCCAA